VSIYVSTWCWQHSRASGADLLVLLAIADQANDDGQEAWPSHATLADRCRVSVKTTQRATQRLMELGELTVDRHAGPASQGATRQHPNKYSFPAYQAYRKQGQSDAASARAAAKAATSAPRSGDILARSSDTAVSPYPSLDPSLNLDPKSKPTGDAVAPPQDDHEQPSLPDASSVQAAVQDLGTGPELEADLFAVETPSADDLVRPAVRHEAAWLDLWDLWPRHVGKAPALKAWGKAVKLADPQEILDGARRYATATRGTDPRFVKHLGPWLNDQRWTDEPEPVGNGRGGGHVPFQCPTDDSAYDEPLRARA